MNSQSRTYRWPFATAGYDQTLALLLVLRVLGYFDSSGILKLLASSNSLGFAASRPTTPRSVTQYSIPSAAQSDPLPLHSRSFFSSQASLPVAKSWQTQPRL